jgi:hypothetical protein
MTEKTVKTYRISSRWSEIGPTDTSSRLNSALGVTIGKSRVIINKAQIGVGPHSYISTNRRLKGDVVRNPKSGPPDPGSQTG